MKSARLPAKNTAEKPVTPRTKKSKSTTQSLSARIARLSSNPRQEIWKAISLKMLYGRVRAAFMRIAPQQILALAMLTVAISVVDRPNAEAALMLWARFHVPVPLFALVTITCGAILLVRPYTALFFLLTLPFALYIAADLVYYATISNGAYTAPILFAALYLVIIRLTLGGKKGAYPPTSR